MINLRQVIDLGGSGTLPACPLFKDDRHYLIFFASCTECIEFAFCI